MKSFLVGIAVLLHPFSGLGQVGVEYAPLSRRVPILVTPADSATAVAVRPWFVWSRAAADSQYVLQIAADTAFSSPILVDTVAFDTVLMCPVALPNDSTFFWRVGIIGPAPDSLFSVTRSFRTTRLPLFSTSLLVFPDTRKGREITRELFLYNPMSDTLVVDSVWSRTTAWRVTVRLPQPISDTLVVDSVWSRTAAWRDTSGFPNPMSDTLAVDSAWARTVARRDTSGFPNTMSDALAVDSAWTRTAAWRTSLPNTMPDTLTVDSAWSRTVARRDTSDLPCSIAAGDSAILIVTYRPVQFGGLLDTLHVATNAGLCALPLAGLSSPPVLLLSPSFVALGPVAFTDTGQVSVMIHNSGPTNDLTLRTLRTRTPLFSFSPAVFSAISPGDSQRVRVKFHMRALRREMFGVYFDTLLVDSDGGRARVLIRGESPPPQIGVE